MNRLCYRLVFNQARGLIMAVAEIVKPMGAGGGRSAASVAASRRLGVILRGIVWASWCALAGASALAGGIVADPNAPAAQRPNVINTANGLPQVNIQAPSAAGVSRNQYSQFDVDKRGAILNNSGTSVQTQLGGWVQGNPNLNPAAPARVILNEVNSANPSQLRGFLEVAGGRAQVIVANPSGILCDGCGTINAGRMTLTTGRPELNPDGSLAGYRVESGVIRIEGAGMQAGSTEYAELMARAVEVQAGLWAPQLSVSAGRNRISADHQNIQALAADRAGRPGFAIDVAQLGGMYAGKIRLLATEAGVGVRSSGQLSGDEQLKLDSAGQLTLNGRQNGGDIQYRAAGNIEHSGASYSPGKLEVSGDAALRQSGTLAAAGDVKVSARDIVANGDFAAGSDDKAQVGTTGALSLKASDSLQLSGHALAGSSLNLNAAAMNAADAKLRANDSVTLTAENGLGLSRANVNTGRLEVQAGGRIDSDAATLQAGQWQASAAALNNLGGVWEQIGQGSGDFRIGQLLDNRGGRIEADSLALSLGQLDNGGGKLLALSDAAQSWSVRQSLSNRGGLIGGNGNLSLNVGSLDNAGGAVQSARRLTLRIDAAAGNRGGKLLAAEGLSLDAGSLDNRDGGRVDGGGSLALNTSGLLDNRAGLLAGSANVAVSAGALSNAKGAIESQGELRLSAQGLLDNSQGKLLSGRAQTLKAGCFANDGGSIGSRAGLTLASGAASNRGGEILSLGDGELQLASLDNAGGKVLSDGKLRVRSQGDIQNHQGLLSTLKQLELHSGDGKIDNKGGKLQAGDTLALSAQQLNNGQGGVIDGDGKLTLNSAGQLGNDGGRIRGSAAVAVTAGGLSNAGGALESKTTLVVKVDGALDNHGGKLLSEQAQSLQSASLNNDKGSIGSRAGLTLASGAVSNRGGEILSLGEGELKLASLDNAGGKVHGDGKLELQAQGDIQNRKGQFSALKQMELHSQAGKLDNQGGKLLSGGALNTSAKLLDNSQGGVIDGRGALKLSTNDGLDNRAGNISAGAGLTAQAANIDNAGGAMESEAALTLSASGRLNNEKGLLLSHQQQSLKAGSLNNDGGDIVSRAALKLQTGVASNQSGRITSLGDGVIQSDQLDNRGGKLQSGGALTLLSQGEINNQLGRISVQRAMRLDGSALRNQQGTLAGGEDITVRAGQMSNQNGAVASQRGLSLTLDALDNRDGKMQTLGEMTLNSVGLLNNQDGKLVANQGLQLSAGELDNQRGLISSGQAISVGAGALRNQHGKLISSGDASYQLTQLLNQDGELQSGGAAQLSLSGALDNSRGKIITDQGLQLKAAAVNNASGMLSSRGALSLSAGELGNRYGSLLSLGDIKLGLSGFDNQYGQVQTAGALEAQLSGQIDNRQGKLIADRDQRLRTSQLHNQGGAVSSGQALSLHAGQLNNQSGNMVGQTSLSLDLQQDYVFRDGDTLASQGPLSLRTSGSLRNEGKWANVGNVSLQAASFSNAAGAKLVSGGKLDINGAGQALNQGRLDAEQLSLTASALDNTGMISGRDVTVNGGVIDNHGGQAVLAATRSLSLNAGSRLSNRDSGYIYSGGALSLSSGDLIENISTTIEAEGDVSIRAGRLNNQRTHVDIKRAAESENYSWYKYNYYWDVFERVGGWDWSAVTKSLPVNDAEAAKTRYGTILQVNEAKKQALVRFQGTQERWVNYNAIKKNDSGGYDMTFYQGYSCFQGAACPYEHTVWREVWSGRNEQWNPAIHINPLELDFVDPNNKFNLRNRSASGTKTRDKLISVGEVASLSAGGNMTVNISGQLLNDASRIAANGGITINGADNGGGDARVINRAYSVNERIQETGTDHYDRNTRHWFPTYTLDKTVALQTIDATIAGHQGVSVRAPSIENITINPAQVSAAEAAKAAAQAEQAAWDGSQTAANAGQARGGQGPEAGRLGQVQSGGEALPLSLGAGERIAPSAGNNAVAAVQAGTAAQQVKMEQNPSTVGPALEGAKLAHAQAGGAPVAAQVATTQPRAQTHPLKGSPAQPGLLDRLPNNQLFQQNPSPTAPYLIETDSRFTEYSNFVSSDYMLKQLNYDPAGVHKRLGDGYYEQKLVRDQILALTGRPSLRGEDATEQFKALMNQGVSVAKDFRLTTGVSLTPAQIAALQQDIVWMVRETVHTANGPQTVLVPTVYLAHNTVGLTGDGAVIAGKDLSLSAASLSNSGRLQADQSLIAKADVIRNTGGLIQADTVKLLADSLTLDTDLQNAGRQAAVSGRDISLSGADIALKGAKIDATELLSLSASNNLTLGTARSRKEGSVDLIAGSMGNRDATLGPDVGGSGVATVSGVWENAQGSSLQSGGKLNLSAGKDLTLSGSSAQAKGQLNVSAGNRLSVLADKTTNNTTLTADSASSRVEARYQADTLMASQLSGGAGVVAVAGQALSVQGSRVASDQGQVLLSGTQVDIGATARHVEIDDAENNHIGQTRSQRQQAIRDTQAQGSQIGGQQGVTIQARNTDIKVLGSDIVSDKGDLKLSASRDIQVGAAEESYSFQEQSSSTRKSLVSSKQSQGKTDNWQTTAKGSSLSGDSIRIQAGQDLTVAGSSVAATHDVDLLAGRDVNLVAAEDNHQGRSHSQTRRSGLMGGSGLGFSFGRQQQSLDQQNTSSISKGSLLGSSDGNVTLRAGRNVQQTGSAVLAIKGDINVNAERITIEAAREMQQSQMETQYLKSGLSVGVTNPVVDSVNTARRMSQAASKTDSEGMKALAALTSAMTGFDAYNRIKESQGATIGGKENQIDLGRLDRNRDAITRDANATDKVGGVNVSISVGSSSNKSRSQHSRDQSVGSMVVAGGNITMVASGAGKNSDINIQGSEVNASRNITLRADNQVNLLASQNMVSQLGSNSSRGGSLGVSFGSDGLTLNVGANAGRGKMDGEDKTWTNSRIEAGQTLRIVSGQDTNLKGAQASGRQMVAQVGGDLNIESLKEQSRYDSTQHSIGLGLSVGYGTPSASASYNQSKRYSRYDGVVDQSGLKAGDGGFQIEVQNNTDLKGGTISSSSRAVVANNNLLATGTLTASDIENRAEVRASNSGLSLSTDMLNQGKYGAAKGVTGALANETEASGDSKGQTLSAISQGQIFITDEVKQQVLTGRSAEEAVRQLNRNAETSHQAAFRQDLERLAEKVDAETAIKTALYAEAVKFTDEAYRKLFLQQHPLYKKKKDAEGKDKWVLASEEEMRSLKPGPDGKLSISINGIFNNEVAAGNYASQHNQDDSATQYYIHFPEANNIISELMIAGYQKFLESEVMGLSTSTVQLRNILLANGMDPLQVNAHSRGSLTLYNALDILAREEKNKGALSGTRVGLFGPAANADKTNQRLSFLQNRTDMTVEQQVLAELMLQNHKDDFVGRILGGILRQEGRRRKGQTRSRSGLIYLMEIELRIVVMVWEKKDVVVIGMIVLMGLLALIG
ncbi:hemagglutinin repeat-containing protein [Chromobacterium haemolyticum]|uniref:hemagglutinin repeat-containing protein n=1 Tax=Chromobacterium haemolyticum TaxID=394935 RepID=UPI002952DB64|nr:hemagglutinin repeat-containing protein [Chromobacterium haemolyticum]WON84489.1 hemagglutinin repeat-containing protein [Chromobacterium haemolyticum]